MASKSPASPPPALSPAQARIDWLTIPAKRVPVLPQWLPFHRLPPMALGPKQLNIEESAVLISLLKKKDTLESTSKLLQRDAEPISLDHWLRAVFELWRETGGKTPDRWILTIMNLGGDACATALGNAARQWAKDLNRVRANEAILQLQRIGSIASLMEINHIAQTTQRGSVRFRALDALEECASEQGLSLAELEDRIVPDCGLDTDGRCSFDYGPRTFQLTLTPALDLRITDNQGAMRDDLPKPLKSDDQMMAAAAVGRWKTMKKQLRSTLSIQSQRFERAMGGRRHWSPSDFSTLLVNHPVLQQLTRRLLWAAHDVNGQLIQVFRVCEDKSLADAHDKPITLTNADSFSIPHPLLLSASVISTWVELFGDYEIIQPFDQLERTTFTLTPAERTGTQVLQLVELGAEALSLGLAKFGWISSSFWGGLLTKSWPEADVTAILQLDGAAFDYASRTTAFQQIQSLYFMKGLKGPNDVRQTLPGAEDAFNAQNPASLPAYLTDPVGELLKQYPPLPLNTINECVISDTIRDLRSLIDRPTRQP